MTLFFDPPDRRQTLQELLDLCREHRHSLTPWERRFVDNLSARWSEGGSLSDRQRNCLGRILDKIEQ
jgi:hypothetical protein